MVVLVLFAAVCCAAPLSGAISAVIALQTRAQASDVTGGSAADIPARMLTAYQKAVHLIDQHAPACRGMRWPILAGIAKVESNHAIGHTITAAGTSAPRFMGCSWTAPAPAATPPPSRTPTAAGGTAPPTGNGLWAPSSSCRHLGVDRQGRKR